MIKTNFDELLVSKSLILQSLELLYYKQKKVSHRSPVVKGLSLNKIAFHQNEIIKFFVREIKEHNFKSHHLKKVKIPQEDKIREIYTLNWFDKLIQAHIKEILEPILNQFIVNNVYSFRKGSGPLDAIDAYLRTFKNSNQEPYLLQMDIKKYGDNIDHHILLTKLDSFLNLKEHPLFREVLSEVIKFSFIENEKISEGQGIASGSPLIPLFENFYLSELDQEILAKKPLFYGRYGDDMLIVTSSKSLSDEIKDHCLQKLKSLKLEVQPNKIYETRLHNKEKFSWLGYALIGGKSTSIKEKHFEKFKKDLKIETHRLIYLLRRFNKKNIPSAQDLATGLARIDHYLTSKYANRCIQYIIDDLMIKKIDEIRIHYLVNALVKNFPINKKQAWKICRAIKRESFNQKRMHFLRKKQWPKVPLRG